MHRNFWRGVINGVLLMSSAYLAFAEFHWWGLLGWVLIWGLILEVMPP